MIEKSFKIKLLTAFQRGICLAASWLKKGEVLMNLIKTQIYMIGMLLLIGCGGSSDSSVRAVVSGQQFEIDVQDSNCFAGNPTGPATSGFDGALDAPLICTINFRSPGFFQDHLIITVRDVVAVYHNYLGQWIEFNAGLVAAEISFQAQNQGIFSGQIVFSEISNLSGRNVSFDFQIQTGNTFWDGHVSNAKIRVGF